MRRRRWLQHTRDVGRFFFFWLKSNPRCRRVALVMHHCDNSSSIIIAIIIAPDVGRSKARKLEAIEERFVCRYAGNR